MPSNETTTLMESFIRQFASVSEPIPRGFSKEQNDMIVNSTDAIIDIFAQNKMTYWEAHAILNFTKEVLDYKSRYVEV